MQIPGFMQLTGENSATFSIASHLDFNTATIRPNAGRQTLEGGTDSGESTFADFKFRAISARYLGSRGYFLEFPEETLKKALPVFQNMDNDGALASPVKVVRNHEFSAEAVIGYIHGAVWAESSKEIPSAGINTHLKIDRQLGADLIRRLLSDPPLLDSVSIAFDGQYEQSHPELDLWSFYDMLGHEVDGKLVRLIVTEISRINHLGIVWAGADAHAKRLSAAAPWPAPALVQANGTENTDINDKQPKDDSMKIELSQADLQELASVLSLEEIQTAGAIVEAATTLAEANEQVREELKKAQAKATEYDAILTRRRDELTALVEKTRPEKNNAGTLRILAHLSFSELADLETELNDELAAQFPDGGRSSEPDSTGGGEPAKATVPATAFQS